MQFMFLVKANADSEAGRLPNEEFMAAMGESVQRAFESGVMVAAGGLRPSSEGARVSLTGGKVTVVDGPFTETKELVGGWAIMELESREAAIEAARDFVEMHRTYLGDSYEIQTEVRQVQA